MIPFGRLHIEAVLRWFQENGIRYPWGETPDPYRVWISEIMLQQTTVTAVIPFYQRWMKQFPDLESFANATEEQALRQWEGLGYYSRVRNALKTARILVYEKTGVWPESVETLRTLPGIGPYTAAAISGFAFGGRDLVFDANVRRILCRVAALPLWSKERELSFSEGLQGLLKPGETALWNGAIMQLGQLVCRNRQPRCKDCPLGSVCKGYRLGAPERYPNKQAKRIRKFTTLLLIFVHDAAVIMMKRKEGVGAGLWVYPERAAFSSDLPEGEVVFLGEFDHFYTTNRETLYVDVLFSERELPENPLHTLKIPVMDLVQRPMPAIYRKITDQLILLFKERKDLQKSQS